MRNLTEIDRKSKRDEKRARMMEFSRRINAMTDENRRAFTDGVGIVTIEGRALSTHNMMMLLMQSRAVTVVGGFKQWIKSGRAVRKGEHGLTIWVPAARKGKEGEPADTFFVLGTVFDISQTDPIEEKVEPAICSARFSRGEPYEIEV